MTFCRIIQFENRGHIAYGGLECIFEDKAKGILYAHINNENLDLPEAYTVIFSSTKLNGHWTDSLYNFKAIYEGHLSHKEAIKKCIEFVPHSWSPLQF